MYKLLNNKIIYIINKRFNRYIFVVFNRNLEFIAKVYIMASVKLGLWCIFPGIIV